MQISQQVAEAAKEGGFLAGRRARKRSREGDVDRDLEYAQSSLSCIINHACAKEELYMGILDQLLGGGQRQKEYRDFVDRYEQGDPSEGYSDQELLKRDILASPQAEAVLAGIAAMVVNMQGSSRTA
jgi:hypothetical protein